MPLNEKQLEAARANGAKTRGPISPEGKRNSSRNALRHGLLARTVVFPDESRERFAALLKAFCDELQPETPIEDLCAQKMAVSHWRQERLWNREKANASQATGQQDAPLMNLHEMRLDRQFGRALDRFMKYRELRKKQNIANEPS